MEIKIGKTSGFCFGVKNAVEKAKEVLEQKAKVYCLGELVHNKGVISDLEEKGLITVEKIEEVPEGETCIVRAHGIAKEGYELAKKRKITLIDLTCPKVLQIHEKVKEYIEEGYYIFLCGKKEHPETKGTASFGKGKISVIEKVEDIGLAIKESREKEAEKIVILAQTTFGKEDFEDYTKKIKEELETKEIKVDNTICNSTNVRQKETEEIAKQVDFMIIIGGKHSSNTTELYEIAKKYTKEAVHIESVKELEEVKQKKGDFLQGREKIGIMAGASTPQEVVEEIAEKIKK